MAADHSRVPDASIKVQQHVRRTSTLRSKTASMLSSRSELDDNVDDAASFSALDAVDINKISKIASMQSPLDFSDWLKYQTG